LDEVRWPICVCDCFEIKLTKIFFSFRPIGVFYGIAQSLKLLVTSYRAGGSNPCSVVSGPDLSLGPKQRPLQWVPGALSPRDKTAGVFIRSLISSGVEVNVWSFLSASRHIRRFIQKFSD
jgi:hypothetical protein